MPIPWSAQTYESGVPVQSPGDRFAQTIQPILVVGFAAMILWNGHGLGPVRIALCLVCSALMLTVRVPDRLIDPRARVVIALVAGLCAGVLMGLTGQGWSGTFAYMVAVHSGVRFPARTAIAIVTVSVTAAVVSDLLWGWHTTLWWTNLLVYAALVPGMTRRARLLTLQAAHEVVASTRRAAESEAQSRALAERAAIARDIHDVLAHSLSGVNMQLSLADALFDAGQSERGREAVHTAQRLVVEGLDEARAAVQTLRGDTVDPIVAIERSLTGPGESFDVTGRARALSSSETHALVRIAQESVTNARRHASGAALRLRLDFAGDGVVFTACNAAAAQTEANQGSGLGLLGMRERAASIGAALHAGPLPAGDPDFPGGWLVRLELAGTASTEDE